jgi:hypothetical protein
MTWVSIWRQVACGQHSPRIGAHQQRAIAPSAHEVGIIPVVLNHQVGQAEGDRAVRAGPYSQPDIRLAGEAGVARIDHNQSHAAFLCCDRGGRVRQAGGAGVVAPQDQTSGMGDVRHGSAPAAVDAPDAVSIASGKASAPTAHIQIGEAIGRAEGVHQPVDETGGIRGRGRGGGGNTKGDSFWPILVCDPAHSGGGQIERRIPANPLPARIGIALRARAPQRMR